MMAGIRRAAFRALNRMLGAAGLRLDRLERDYDDVPLDDVTRTALLSRMADAFDLWVASQTLFDRRAPFDTRDVTRDFFDAWLRRPFRDRQGGSRFNNLLWLHLIARAFAPDVIVDSGTYQGASAWALASACPQARTFSFDIDLSQLRLRADSVTYVQSDWSAHDLDLAPADLMLCYFDDHVDQVKRLLEASRRRCRLALFDDDYPVTSFFTMAPTPAVLPKLEFALDAGLTEGQVLSWRARGKEQRWTVDRAYLDAALATIAATERLPNTSLITGIHQTPYRVVALKPGAGPADVAP
jgi:hypothetical protein